MIQFEHFGYYLPQGYLFQNVNLQINPSDKIGLVGKNGAGKSTLLNLISNQLSPTEGKIIISKNYKIGYLSQEIQLKSDEKLINFLMNSNTILNEINNNIEKINTELVERSDYESESYLNLLDQLEEENIAFNIHEGHNWQERVESTLLGLGFDEKNFSQPLNSFSGGWKMRAELARILVNKPDILLLDEPTNHLDIMSIGWLEEYLKKYESIIILISHDRIFLDRVTNKTLEISQSKILDYPLPFSKYKIKREEEKQIQEQAKKQQDKSIKQTENLINKFRAKSSKAAFAQSLIKKLDKLERIEIDNDHVSSMKLTFPVNQEPGKKILEFINVSKKYGENTIFKEVNLTIGKGDKIALLGPNGVGKSTLFKCIMSSIEYHGEIILGHNVKPSYFAQDQVEKLNPNLSIFETVDQVAVGENRKNIRSILGSFLFSGEDIDKKVSVLSGGEKTRLSICLMLFEPSNFLILDEPTNHLDIMSKEVLKIALKNYQGTFIIVSHDREFLKDLSNQIWDIEASTLKIHYFSIEEYISHKNNSILSDSQIKFKVPDTNREESSKSNKKSKKVLKSTNTNNQKLSKIEAEIQTKENEIKMLENKLLDLKYNDPEYNMIVNDYEKNKKELEVLMTQWEKIYS